MFSVDFSEIEILQRQENWDAMAAILSNAACAVETAGADFLIICTNTMHKVAPKIQQKLNIPILHIADAMADALQRDGITRVGLLGTRFTMEQTFYRERLESHGITVLIPEQEERDTVHNIIYSELCLGVIEHLSRTKYLSIVDSLARNGAEAVILGCTEIALLIQQQHTNTPLYDTAKVHAEQAVAYALQ